MLSSSMRVVSELLLGKCYRIGSIYVIFAISQWPARASGIFDRFRQGVRVSLEEFLIDAAPIQLWPFLQTYELLL